MRCIEVPLYQAWKSFIAVSSVVFLACWYFFVQHVLFMYTLSLIMTCLDPVGGRPMIWSKYWIWHFVMILVREELIYPDEPSPRLQGFSAWIACTLLEFLLKQWENSELSVYRGVGTCALAPKLVLYLGDPTRVSS